MSGTAGLASSGLAPSGVANPDWLLEERGVHAEFAAFVVGAAWAGDALAYALGDGTIRLLDGWRTVEAHDGAVLSLAAHPSGWVTGGDDGVLRRTSADGAGTNLASFGSRWVEQVAAHPSGPVACGVGKAVHLFDVAGARLKELPHPSTVTGIAFDGKGKRVAASHYNGATVWFVGAKVDTPRTLEWKGSHIGVALHPTGEACVSAMQENSLHGWRLSDGQHMRMSGYPAKSRSLSFSRTGKWLATSGADSVVLWPFFGGGPMGKAPTELAGGDGVICTSVACHPAQDMVAAGFNDGLVVLADVNSSRILPVAAPGRGAVSALAWNADGSRLAFGTETGFAACVDLSKR